MFRSQTKLQTKVVLTAGGGEAGGGRRALPAAQLAGYSDGVGGGSLQAAELLLGCISGHRDLHL